MDMKYTTFVVTYFWHEYFFWNRDDDSPIPPPRSLSNVLIHSSMYCVEFCSLSLIFSPWSIPRWWKTWNYRMKVNRLVNTIFAALSERNRCYVHDNQSYLDSRELHCSVCSFEFSNCWNITLKFSFFGLVCLLCFNFAFQLFKSRALATCPCCIILLYHLLISLESWCEPGRQQSTQQRWRRPWWPRRRCWIIHHWRFVVAGFFYIFTGC